MGAAIRQNGEPSPALVRRLTGALKAKDAGQPYKIIVTGGRGETQYVEADVMKSYLLDRGVVDENILCERQATNTLSSVLFCRKILLESDDFAQVHICSDHYHIPRILWLFSMYGITVTPAWVESGQSSNSRIRWAYFYLREYLAILVDTLLVFSFKLFGFWGKYNSTK